MYDMTEATLIFLLIYGFLAFLFPDVSFSLVYFLAILFSVFILDTLTYYFATKIFAKKK